MNPAHQNALADVINLDRWDLTDDAFQARCRTQLDNEGVIVLPDFFGVVGLVMTSFFWPVALRMAAFSWGGSCSEKPSESSLPTVELANAAVISFSDFIKIHPDLA